MTNEIFLIIVVVCFIVGPILLGYSVLRALKERKENKLKTELIQNEKKPEGKIGYVLLLTGFTLIFISIIYSHTLSAYIGITLVFWGALLFFIRPTKFTRTEMLDEPTIAHTSSLRRWWPGVLVVISLVVLVSSVGGYWVGVNRAPSNNNGTPTNQPTSFLVWNLGSNYYSENMQTGSIASGTNAATIIQNALNGLTSGRTWKEKVVLKGNFTLSTSILIPSYTTVEIQGVLKLTNGVNCTVISNPHIKGDSNIEVYGGIIDGNRAHQSDSLMFGILFNGATYLDIHDIKIINTLKDGLRFYNCSQGNVNNIFTNNTGNHAIFVGYSSSYFNLNNIVSYNSGTEFVCIEWTNTENAWNRYITVNNVVGHNGGNSGIYIGFCQHVAVSNCLCYNTRNYSYQVESNAMYVSIDNCQAISGPEWAFGIKGQHVTITNNKVLNRYGLVYTDVNTTDVVIDNNQLYNTNSEIKHGAIIFGYHNYLTNNIFNVTTPSFQPVLDYGYNTFIDNNVGYEMNTVEISPLNWSEVKSGTGTGTAGPLHLNLSPGQRAESTDLFRTPTFVGQDKAFDSVDYQKRIEFSFWAARNTSDTNALYYILITQSKTFQDLTAPGIGIKINNFNVTGESYGSTLGTLFLGNLSSSIPTKYEIIVKPFISVDFYVNGVYKGSTTGTAVPTDSSTIPSYFTASAGNGANPIDARLYCGGFKVRIQR